MINNDCLLQKYRLYDCRMSYRGNTVPMGKLRVKVKVWDSIAHHVDKWRVMFIKFLIALIPSLEWLSRPLFVKPWLKSLVVVNKVYKVWRRLRHEARTWWYILPDMKRIFTKAQIEIVQLDGEAAILITLNFWAHIAITHWLSLVSLNFNSDRWGEGTHLSRRDN